MGLSITILQPASLTATVNGGAILAAVVGKSATLNIEMGVPGPGATVQVGTTTTGDAGTDASVVNVGTTSAAILDFTIPRGDKGEQGDQGPQGIPGQTGQTGPKGDKGDTGATGAGVAVGGSAGQVLAKIDGTNYNTHWITPESGGGVWGTITGTLSNQTDLQSALDGKLSLTGGTVTGSVTIDGAFAVNPGGDPATHFYTNADGFFNFTNDNGGRIFTDGQRISFNDGIVINETQINFPDNTSQSTAFPPAGGTTTQYIDGTGALVEFPTVIKTAKQMVTLVRNNSGATITKGTVVYINGAVGNKPTIAKAQANSESTSKATFAFVETDILNNTDGNVVQMGLIENIDTQGFSDGTQIFLSPTTAGGWTSTQPFSPYHYVRLGTIIRGGHPTQGSISINIINGFQLDELSDVGSTAPTNNNVLTWQSSTSQWLDRSITTILGYTPANDTLGNLSNTTTARSNLGLTSLATASYATQTQAEAMTSTTTVLSPARFRDGFFTANVTKPNTSTWLTGTSGTGGLNDSATWDLRRLEGPTSAANTYVRCDHGTNVGRGRNYNANIDWSKYNAFQFRITQYGGADANSIFRAVLGEVSGTNTGDPTVRSVGIRFNGTGAIKILAHNGTTLTTYTTSYSLTSSSNTDILVVSDGSGTVEVFANGTSIGSTTGGPTTLLAGTASQSAISYRVENNNTPSGSQVKVILSGTTIFTS